MKAVVQRVAEARVEIDGEVVGEIGAGLVVLAGVSHSDDRRDATAMVEKIAGLRIFADPDGLMNRSVTDVDGEVLVVSQFTLYGDVRRGRRPSFSAAADPAIARTLYEAVLEGLADRGLRVASGRFGATMDVHLVNHGPVTILLETVEGRFI